MVGWTRHIGINKEREMRYILQLFLIFLFMPCALAGSIVAKVNDVPITSYDLNNYTRMVLVTSKIEPSRDAMKKFRPQVLDQLIEQQIKRQAIEAHNISVTKDEMDLAIANIESQSESKRGSLRQILRDNDIDEKMLEGRIFTDIGWFKLINIRFGNKIQVDDGAIREEIKSMKSSLNRPYVNIYEIFLPVESVLVDNEIYARASSLVEELRNNGSFERYAAQFSYSPTRSAGGNTGWLPLEELPKEFSSVIGSMKPGDISQPVRTVDGYYILLLKDKKVSMDENYTSSITEDSVRMRLVGNKLEQFSKKYLRDIKRQATIEKVR